VTDANSIDPADDTPPLEETVQPIAVYHDAALKRLDIQIGRWDQLDGKAHNALSIGSAILPITFGLLGVSSFDVPLGAKVILVLAVVAYFVLLGCSWLILRTTSRMAVGAPMSVLHQYLEEGIYTGDGLLLWVDEEYDSSTRQNEGTLFRKTTYVGRANFALYAESTLLAIAGIVTLLVG
jgi:hypothetical protein